MLQQLLDKAKSLPTSPGCYLMKKGEEVIYVGKAKNLRARVQSYFNQSAKSHKTTILVSHITDFEFMVVESEQVALITENILIKKYSPRYNIRLRDDKSYPYVVVNFKESFPRPVLSRQKKRENDVLYLGPFATGSNIKQVFRTVLKICGLRDCSLQKMRRFPQGCLLYQMHQCVAPCRGEVSAVEYQERVEKFIRFFSGDDVVLLDAESKMRAAAKQEEFELAALWRDALEEV
jgi:excinuclease ABC subunit C